MIHSVTDGTLFVFFVFITLFGFFCRFVFLGLNIGRTAGVSAVVIPVVVSVGVVVGVWVIVGVWIVNSSGGLVHCWM